MNHGKTIEMFLVDGTADGIVTAELSNWNGKAIKLPRTEVAACERQDIAGVGVYFLFGSDKQGETVYIGESENVLKRLKQHLNDKPDEYWSCAVAFTSPALDKALIRYLEDRLVALAHAAGRYRVTTQNTYGTHVSESQKATMEEFIDNMRVLLSAMNFRVLEPVPAAKSDTVILRCRSKAVKDEGRRADAKGFVSPNATGFTVLAGSRVAAQAVPSFATQCRNYAELREQLIANGTIQDGVFARDYEFSAPSAASAVVLGRSSNGNVDWRTEDGVKLGALE